MKKLIFAAVAATMLAACGDGKVKGVVVRKQYTKTATNDFYTLYIECDNGATIPCNVSDMEYMEHQIGDSVCEKGKYFATTSKAED